MSSPPATRGSRLFLGLGLLLGLAVMPSRGAEPAPDGGDDPIAQQVRPLLVKYCGDCHQGDSPRGKFSLAGLQPLFDQTAPRTAWLRVYEQLDGDVMPPPDEARPTGEERTRLLTTLRSALERGEQAQRAREGRVPLRRLNRVEYENTIRDLLGIHVRLKEQLPQDGSSHGFDNAAAAHHTSSFLMEKYLEAAETALNLAVSNRPQAPPATTVRRGIKDAHPVRTSTESVYRFLDDTVVCFCSSAWHNVSFTGFYPQEPGRFRFRIAVSAYQSGGKPVTFRVTYGNMRLNGKDGLIGYFDALPDQTRVIEFEQDMDARTTIQLLPYGLASAQTVKQVGAEDWQGPGLAVHYLEAEGPLNDAWPPESHRRLLGELPRVSAPIKNFSTRVETTSEDPLDDAERLLKPFLRRAFRRQVTERDVAPYVEIVKLKLAGGYTFEQAMRAAWKGILIAPEFIFLVERPGRLDDFALASRLSYFLWSTMPDETLLELAERGELSRPEVLRAQVERLLQDRRAVALSDHFVGQWLGVRDIDFTEPSHLLYPEFDHLLKVSMMRETELFFEELLRHDLSVTNFVSSNFTMLNGRLAKHYGMPGIEGWAFQRVTVPPESHRGGVLTMASVLKVTANGTTTSPVMRGAWVLDRILGTPPAPPPEDIPVIEPDVRGATTIREQLAKHRSVASCSTCHVKIDPPGFALESFDCIGGWRDHYRVTGSGETVYVDGRRMSYHKGKKVDPSDKLADGTPFANVDEFKQLLLRDPDAIARALAVKLTTYSTGGAPSSLDRPAIDALVDEIRPGGYGLRSLIHAVVASPLFHHK